MLEHVWIVECDLCGETANLVKGVDKNFEPYDYTMPEGWDYGANKDCQFCPKCLKRRTNKDTQPKVASPDPEYQLKEVLYG